MFKALTKQSEWPFQLFFILQFGVETCIANVGAGPAGWKWGKFQLHDCSFVWAGLGWAGHRSWSWSCKCLSLVIHHFQLLSFRFTMGQKVGSKILLHSLCMVASVIIEDAIRLTPTLLFESSGPWTLLPSLGSHPENLQVYCWVFQRPATVATAFCLWMLTVATPAPALPSSAWSLTASE